MSLQENQAVVRRYWQDFESRNFDDWDQLCSDKFVNHDPSLPEHTADLQTNKQNVREMILRAFPDMTSTEDDLLAAGDEVVTRRSFQGTHQGEFFGVAPTGKKVSFTGIIIDKLSNGKIDEQWVEFDALGILQQIGGAPTQKH